ncbi:MAG TPA: FtsX-like permease family protein [Vicinamibacterales bacterium]|nr:FtsX-like permease family protein [Vicinamibacterales bacterium]
MTDAWKMRWRLFRQFILRPLLQDRARTLTTSAGIALGVGVVIAIQLTNHSSIRGFETALETVAGKAAVEIVGVGGIDETVLPDLIWLREFGTASPVIDGEMALVQGPARMVRRAEALRVLGVDILRDRTLRQYMIGAAAAPDGSVLTEDRGEITPQRFLELLTSPQSVVITEKLAERRGYALGSEIQLMAGDRINTYVVRGLLKDEGPARVMDGSFVLMDIAAAQFAFARLGRIDRIDVELPGSPDSNGIDAIVAAIGARLPAGLTAQRPSRRGEQVERMLAAFHTNLTAMSWVALVVGLFLVYNTVTISVIARREEIGTLRALGVTRGQVLALFLGEAAVLGVAGSLLGIGLGRVLADFAVGLTSATVSTLYIATAAGTPALTWELVVLAFAIGFPLALVAAWLPAREASQVTPTAAMRGHDRLTTRVGLPASALVLPAIALAAAGGLALLGPVNGRPLFGYLSSFVTIIGASLCVPAVVYGLARLLRTPLRRVLGVEGLLAHASLTAAIPRLSISIAALAVALSMTVAVVVMIGSFRDTVVYWVGQTLQADLFIGPGMRPTVGSAQTLSPAVIDAVRAHPDVEALDSARNVDFVHQDNLVVLGAASFDVVLARGSLLFKEPSDGRAALGRAMAGEPVIVSEAFANKYGTRPGDTLTLDTPLGPRPFPVAAVYYDYAVERGVIIMDHRTITKYFGAMAPSGLAAYLKPGADAERVRAEILQSLDEGHRAFIYTNGALRAEILRIFDSTFAITYALEIIAVIVAMLGVAATLFTLVVERQRELTMLRLVGALRSQVRRAVVIEAALIGGVSQAIGLVVGLALAVILVYVINVQSFGWTIQFRVPVAFLAQISIAVVVATALAGLYPARRAAQLVLTQDE